MTANQYDDGHAKAGGHFKTTVKKRIGQENWKKSLNAICHAEIIAIQKACKKLDSWRLIDCEMYVTLEPCSMCAGALINSRIKKLYIGTADEKTGACGSVLDLLNDYKFNHKIEVEKYILKEECEEILKQFFKFLREKDNSDKKSI